MVFSPKLSINKNAPVPLRLFFVAVFLFVSLAGGYFGGYGVDLSLAGTQCNDGIDNDGDGLIDWQYDLGCYNGSDNTEGGITAGLNNGWTVFELASGAQVIYVSNSTGSDNNDGLSPATPVKSLLVGKNKLRGGAGDWLLLKRGDTWNETLSGLTASGKSASYPTIIGSYGSSTVRPIIEELRNNSAANHFAILGIRFVSPSGPGLSWLGGGTNLLVEDCYFQSNGVTIQNFFGPIYDFKLRRSIIVDNYNTSGNAEGLFIKGVTGVLVEENLFDHNGWNDNISGAEATIFNHNVYIQVDTFNVTAKGNIFSRASSHGFQARTGGTIEDNLFLKNPLGLSFGVVEGSAQSPVPGGVAGSISNNVFLESGDIPGNARGHAIDVGNISSATVNNNVIAHNTGGSPVAMGIGEEFGIGVKNLTVSNNVIYDWPISFNINIKNSNFASRIRNVNITNNTTQNFTSDGLVIYKNHVCKSGISLEEGSDGMTADISYSNNSYYTLADANKWFQTSWFTYKEDGSCGRGQANQMSIDEWVAGGTGLPAVSGDVTQQVSYSDPNRSIETYQQFLGGNPSFESFITEVKKQSRFNWRENYTADNVNQYIRAGFGLGSNPTPVVTCTENWSCTNWGQCSSDGSQIRTCTDLNNCGTSSSLPQDSQSCTPSVSSPDPAGGSAPSAPSTSPSAPSSPSSGSSGGLPTDTPSTSSDTTTNPEDTALPLEPILSGSLIKVFGTSEVWLINDTKRQYVPSLGIFQANGFSESDITEISKTALESYEEGENVSYPDNILIKSDSSNAVYLLSDGGRYVFLNEKYFLSNNYSWNNIISVSQDEINVFRLTSNVVYPNGTLIKGDGIDVYIIDNGIRRKILTEEAFNHLGLGWHNILIVSPFELTFYPEGTSIGYDTTLSFSVASLDSDNDGLYNYMEKILGTDINNPDSDNDGYLDGTEVKYHYNPLGRG